MSEGQEYNSVHSYIATDNFLFAPHELGSLMLALIRLTHLSNLCTLIYWLHGVLTQVHSTLFTMGYRWKAIGLEPGI